jgi:hypothetical protein
VLISIFRRLANLGVAAIMDWWNISTPSQMIHSAYRILHVLRRLR